MFGPSSDSSFRHGAPAQFGMGPEGTAASLSACGSWPWGGLSHLRRWCLFARSPWREVTAHPPPGSPQMAWFPSQCRAEEEKISLYLPRSLRRQKGNQKQKFFRKFFLKSPGHDQSKFSPPDHSRHRTWQFPGQSSPVNSMRQFAAPGTAAVG